MSLLAFSNTMWAVLSHLLTWRGWPCRDAPAGRFSLELWRHHVLANLPMYSMLLPLYLALARSRVSSRCEETLVDLRRVSSSLHAAPAPVSHPRAADVLVGSHETSSGLCMQQHAHSVHVMQIRLSKRHCVRLGWLSHPAWRCWPRSLSRRTCGKLTMSGSWPTWSANEGRSVCA